MRVEPYEAGSIIHVIKRGGRGLAVVTNNHDRNRFRRLLCHMNDEYADDAWESDTSRLSPFERPSHWPARKPLVGVLAYTLMSNHFHLLVRASAPGSVGEFVKRVTGSMSKYHNAKYKVMGSLFQGAYIGKTVDEERYLQYVAGYIMVKNTLELYPGGLRAACDNFNDAWEWAIAYPWSSLGHYAQQVQMLEVDDSVLKSLFQNPKELKIYAREFIGGSLEPPAYLRTTKDI